MVEQLEKEVKRRKDVRESMQRLKAVVV